MDDSRINALHLLAGVYSIIPVCPMGTWHLPDPLVPGSAKFPQPREARNGDDTGLNLCRR
jgi:hypothetical protein